MPAEFKNSVGPGIALSAGMATVRLPGSSYSRTLAPLAPILFSKAFLARTCCPYSTPSCNRFSSFNTLAADPLRRPGNTPSGGASPPPPPLSLRTVFWRRQNCSLHHSITLSLFSSLLASLLSAFPRTHTRLRWLSGRRLPRLSQRS